MWLIFFNIEIISLSFSLHCIAIIPCPALGIISSIEKISEIFSVNEIIPSAGQGIIALQCRQDDKEIISLLKNINDPETYNVAHAERNILKILEGDCETAIGAHAKISNNEIIIEAELFSLDGKRYYEKKTSSVEKAKELGKEIGKILKKKSNNSYKR